MRMSTAGIHNSALIAMQAQQTQLSTTQNQIATGRRVNTPADDPVASVHIMELQRSLQETEQFGTNANMATSRLNLEESAVASVGTLLQRVQELAIEANTATVGPSDRKLIATEVRARVGELMDIANTRDANGEYLFAGFSTKTQPFSQTGATTSYFGDQGSRLLQIGPNQKVSDSHSGYAVFMNVPQGNGTFVTDLAATNTGTGVIGAGSVTDLSQWVPGDYQVLNSAAAVVSTGTYTENGTIAFNGIKVDLTGMPALNDTFTVARSRSEDLFTSLNNLVTTLETGGTTAAQGAQFNSDMARSIQQLDQSSDHLLSIRAEIGARLSSLDSAATAREDHQVELKTTTSQLRDLDYAEAVTRMNQQLMGLQAAQASYSRIAQLSLFSYLR